MEEKQNNKKIEQKENKQEEKKQEEIAKEEKIEETPKNNSDIPEGVLRKEEKKEPKKTHGKLRMSLVLLFIAVFATLMYVTLRGSYLEYQELGENFIPVFYTNLTYKIAIMGINFVILYLIMYFTNKGIKKGLKVFFDKEKKQLPKLPNKSLALMISAIVSVIIGIVFTDKIILFLSNTAFGIQDPIFNLDIAFYMLRKPVIEMLLVYIVSLMIGLSAYTAIYYVIIFNNYFERN